jgi:sensor histidine kinase YesM
MYDENEIIFLSGKSGIVSIMNGIYRTNRVPHMEILAQIEEEKNGSFIRKISDTDYIFVFHTSEKTGMAITYMAERRKILNSVYTVRNIIIEVAVICILCALVLSYLVTSSISVPLNRLKKTMEKVGENDQELAHEYVDDRKDEIGVLGLKFNSMMTRIRNLLDNLIESEVSRKNEEIRRKEAELDALQMQIKPHFMYNTLNFIRWNAIFAENGEGPISKMIEEFSTLLRFNTLRANRLVDINEEVEHLNAYVKVMKFKKELKFRLELNLENDILGYKITKLTFQPIVENAIKYGITGMDSEGIIQINSQISVGDLFIEIRDNGLGMAQERVDIINNQLLNGVPVDGSIGLRNVNERIRLHFGNRYGLKISSEEGIYTSVLIHIPCVLE